MKKEFTCIICPNSCVIQVEKRDDYVITGAGCKRGKKYVLEEMTDPKRTIATSAAVKGGVLPLVSVRLTEPIPLARIREGVEIIHQLCVKAPVKSGEILIYNILGYPCNVIATRTVPEKGGNSCENTET